MSYTYSSKSKANLDSCHSDLQELFFEVIKHVDCTIIEGHRSTERQEQLFREGKTKIRSGGKHNAFPSQAVDAAPYPIDWNDQKRFILFGGFVLGVASQMGIPIRWGGDWNGNFSLADQTFNDYVHFELIR